MDRYLLYVKTVQGGALRGLFETLCHIIHDTNLTWEPPAADSSGGLKVITRDGAKVALVYLKLDGDNFDEYHCPAHLVTGINMGSMWKLLKTASSHDCITFYVSKSDPHEFGIVIDNADKNAKTEYKLKLLDCDSETIIIPDATFDRILTLPSVYFQRLCREMGNIGDKMRISIDGSNLKLVCDGDFARQETVIGESDGCMSVCENTGEPVEGLYLLRYLSLFTRASGLCNTVQMYLKVGYPLVLSYNVANLGSLKFCLVAVVE